MKLSDAFAELEAIYREIPPLPCSGCGACCNSPHLTLIEFAYLLKTLVESRPAEQIRPVTQSPIRNHPTWPENDLCGLLEEKNRCGAYAGRGLGCRIAGFPVLRQMDLGTVPRCERSETGALASLVTEREIDDWVIRVYDLHQRFLPIDEPYFLDSLPLDCWWAVLFDPEVRQETFLQARAMLREEYDLGALADGYADKTGLAAMLGMIDLFFAENERRNAPGAAEAIRRVLEEFPHAGSYYRHPGQQYAEFMAQVLEAGEASDGAAEECDEERI